jgi:hypothetical protein
LECLKYLVNNFCYPRSTHSTFLFENSFFDDIEIVGVKENSIEELAMQQEQWKAASKLLLHAFPQSYLGKSVSCKFEIGKDSQMVVSHILSTGPNKLNKFGLQECEVEDMTKYKSWTTQATENVSKDQTLLYTFVKASTENSAKAVGPVSTGKILFSRCCKLIFDPKNVPGSDVILAPDSDME